MVRVIPFLYESSHSFLHRMDARMRVLCYFMLQVALFLFPTTSLLMLLILFWAMFRYPSLLSHCLKILWLCRFLFLMLLIPVIFSLELLPQSVFTLIQFSLSLMLTQLWLMTTSFSQIITISTWVGSLSRLRLISQCIGFTFLFIPIISQRSAQIIDSMQARNISRRRILRYLMLLSSSLINHLYQEPLHLEGSLLQRNYSSESYHCKFGNARGQWLCAAGLFITIMIMAWIENFISF